MAFQCSIVPIQRLKTLCDRKYLSLVDFWSRFFFIAYISATDLIYFHKYHCYGHSFFFIDLGALIFVVVMCSACLISFFLRRIWFLAVVFICRYKWNRGNGLLTIVSVLLINATRTHHHHHHCQCRAFKLWKWQFTIWSKTVNTKVTTNDRCWPISTTVTDWMSKGQLMACMKQTDRDRMNAWRVREKN